MNETHERSDRDTLRARLVEGMDAADLSETRWRPRDLADVVLRVRLPRLDQALTLFVFTGGDRTSNAYVWYETPQVLRRVRDVEVCAGMEAIRP